MDLGISIANNGWLVSENSPQYMPTFELNKQAVLEAERHGFAFALSMVRFHGFGGKTEFWDHSLESFTLMAGLAAVTERIKIYASVAILTIPPTVVARMASTIDSIAPGRFGINIVSGWAKEEYGRMGLWPATSTSGTGTTTRPST
jgi:pyrimidine oxygenase